MWKETDGGGWEQNLIPSSMRTGRGVIGEGGGRKGGREGIAWGGFPSLYARRAHTHIGWSSVPSLLSPALFERFPISCQSKQACVWGYVVRGGRAWGRGGGARREHKSERAAPTHALRFGRCGVRMGKRTGEVFGKKEGGDACMERGGMLDRLPPSFFPLYSLRGFWPLFSADPCAQQAREWKWKQ